MGDSHWIGWLLYITRIMTKRKYLAIALVIIFAALVHYVLLARESASAYY
jgi:hypothetical protein